MAAAATEQELLYFNGINGNTGQYDLPPMTSAELAEFIQGETPPDDLNELKFRYGRKAQAAYGVKEDIDPEKLDQSGWGIIFAHDADPAIKEALSDLLNLRQTQAGPYFRIYEGSEGHRPGESKGNFLARHGAGPGPADPDKVPYYLLIVGEPDRIPYRFQSQLDVQYAVGRIHFDTLDEYANYARSVVEAETRPLRLPRQISLFGVANPDDPATQLSFQQLVEPLYKSLGEGQQSWGITAWLRDQATKTQLSQLLGGDQTPALLFSASHGLSFSPGDERRRPHQGALLCQDWPGPQNSSGAISQDLYFAGDDLSSDANLLGLIAFFFASYSGGTPLKGDFPREFPKAQSIITDSQAFMAQLPAKMLSQPKGGALAVIGHVQRAWGYSFLWPGAGSQTEAFKSTLRSLLSGSPVGHALEYFNERYAELATVLSDELEELKFGKQPNPYELAGMWMANNDARGYAVIGDPAVRLPVVQPGETAEGRPSIAVQTTGDDLTRIAGIGPRYQEALQAAGISTIVELANVEDRSRLLQSLSEQGLSAGEDRVEVWIEQANDLVYRPPQPAELFPDETVDTTISACQTDRQWCLSADALVLPVGATGSFGGFARALFRRLHDADRKSLTEKIQTSLDADFGPLNPALITLDETLAAQLLPNRPRGQGQKYWLITATAEGVQEITDLRQAARAIVMKAHDAGVKRLCVVPIGSGSGRFPGQSTEVASQMIHGIWSARRDLEITSLTEIIFAPTEAEALEAAREKERILTRNRPQKVWSDQPAVEDLLGIKDEAEALAETLILREVTPPLSVAILGGWGSGKSTVMRLMMQFMTEARVAGIGKGWPDPPDPDRSASAEEEDPDVSTRVGHIYQIRFNAWTYAKSSLWASLMQTIFWELNRQLTAEQQLFELEANKETNRREPLDEMPEFQFLYDEYGWTQPKLWPDLSLETRAALQPGTEKNILWQRLRAKQQKLLRDLQQKESAIARLKAQRERAAAEREEAIILELGQESQAVVYGVLRRRSRALLGALYDQTNEQVNQQALLVLARQLQETLEEIARQATEARNRSAADDTPEIQAALAAVADVAARAPAEPDDKSQSAIEGWLNELRGSLGDVERTTEQTLVTIWSDTPPAPASKAALLADLKRQAYQARRAKGAVESAEELFANMSSVSTTLKKVGAAIGEYRGLSLSIFALFVALIVITYLLFNETYLDFWNDQVARRIAGFITLITSTVALLGPPLRVAAEWSKKVNRLVDEYQEEAEAERQRYQSLIETRLAAALAADEEALQKELNKKVQSGQQPAAKAVLGRDGQPNLASMDYQIKQLRLEADELRRLAGPPGEYESLLDFIQARQDEQFYEKRLGLMHQVKRDIDILTGGLVIQPQDDPEVIKAKRELFPRGPARVVLYIDDLDRCPPQRVVEVLEAVQLLLDTELFVVVLGLDTRYITRALEKEYKEILQPDGDPSGLDYIEKIVQLPYRVRPIGRKGIEGFLKAQMQIVQEETEQSSSERVIVGGRDEMDTGDGQTEGSTDGAGTGASGGAPAPGEPGGTPVGEREQGETAGREDDDGQGETAETSAEAADVRLGILAERHRERQARREKELPPEIVRFQPDDLADLTTICRRLKLTPRNVKRMVNVLKLINVFWFRTGRDLRERKVKSTVMGLLALAASYPEIMREVFEQIDISYRNSAKSLEEPAGEFLDVRELPSTRRWREQHESLIERFRSDVRSLYAAEDLEASLIAVTLNELQEDTFNLVRSFSFVGDPVYLSVDDDGRILSAAAGRDGRPNRLNAELEPDSASTDEAM